MFEIDFYFSFPITFLKSLPFSIHSVKPSWSQHQHSPVTRSGYETTLSNWLIATHCAWPDLSVNSQCPRQEVSHLVLLPCKGTRVLLEEKFHSSLSSHVLPATHPLSYDGTDVCGSVFEGRLLMCLWKPRALFDRAVIHAKELGHSAREGEATIQQDSSDRTGVANPSWLTHLENLHLSDAAVGVAHAIDTHTSPVSWAFCREEPADGYFRDR